MNQKDNSITRSPPPSGLQPRPDLNDRDDEYPQPRTLVKGKTTQVQNEPSETRPETRPNDVDADEVTERFNDRRNRSNITTSLNKEKKNER